VLLTISPYLTLVHYTTGMANHKTYLLTYILTYLLTYLLTYSMEQSPF